MGFRADPASTPYRDGAPTSYREPETANGLGPSFGSRHSIRESWMKTLKPEEIYANDYRDAEDLTAHLEEFIDRYYNRLRLHSALGYRSPEQFEAETASQPAAALRFPRQRRSIDPIWKGSSSGAKPPLPSSSR